VIHTHLKSISDQALNQRLTNGSARPNHCDGALPTHTGKNRPNIVQQRPSGGSTSIGDRHIKTLSKSFSSASNHRTQTSQTNRIDWARKRHRSGHSVHRTVLVNQQVFGRHGDADNTPFRYALERKPTDWDHIFRTGPIVPLTDKACTQCGYTHHTAVDTT
jgi:hypothetical protein